MKPSRATGNLLHTPTQNKATECNLIQYNSATLLLLYGWFTVTSCLAKTVFVAEGLALDTLHVDINLRGRACLAMLMQAPKSYGVCTGSLMGAPKAYRVCIGSMIHAKIT
jgi:hypothetical protein